MSAGLGNQIERKLEHRFRSRWGIVYTSKKWLKKLKLRAERRRAKLNPEYPPAYRKYSGWDW